MHVDVSHVTNVSYKPVHCTMYHVEVIPFVHAYSCIVSCANRIFYPRRGKQKEKDEIIILFSFPYPVFLHA